ncbi:MAG: BREX system Lon protease-like protein BrxL, partial [Leptospiraceae bacterium]|nr:BREX system Lon protease-like protein BrxL [Leptospiraceae bacterium]
ANGRVFEVPILRKILDVIASGKIGLVGYWDVVAFDEFAGKQKKVDKALVDIMKNYMANKTFSRGIETLGAEASMVFVGNTQHNVPYMLKHSDLFQDLPDKFYDSAFLDRLHFFIPGWEVDIIRGEMFSDGYGFVVDYLAEILRSLRNRDYSDRYLNYFTLSSDISTRDRDGINKTFSGLMKIIYPQDGASKEEVNELLKFAIEGRKRVKDQLMRIDATYSKVNFSYADKEGKAEKVTTLEEIEYPNYYHLMISESEDGVTEVIEEPNLGTPAADANSVEKSQLKEQHFTYQENQKGISYDALFGAYIRNCKTITIVDPYIRMFYQVRNLMEFIETLIKTKSPDAEVKVHLVTVADDLKPELQKENFEKIKSSSLALGIQFTWEFDSSNSIHARHITVDNEWKILLDRGLDIFQHYEMNDTLAISNRLQQFRSVKAFEITYIKHKYYNKSL